MVFLGLDITIWVVLILYFAGVLVLGWWSKREVRNQEGYLVGNRRFGTAMMVMHAFGAGTNPGDVAGVVSRTVSAGASGIWVSWMWMFGTPFYWLIAPIVRRMRCLTLADFFQERFGKAASALYILVAAAGMIVCLASVLLATTRTAQGMMGKGEVQASGAWFFGILFVTTAVFILYSYWGGIVAAIRTDMIQGLMIIALSIVAVPAALSLEEVGGLEGMRETLEAMSTPQQGTPNATSRVWEPQDYLSLFDPKIGIWTVILLSINAPLSALAFPHLIPVCGAGKTEWEGRVGFAYGNLLKRICTIGWSLLGLAWLAYLFSTGSAIHPDAAFGDSIRTLLSPALQGVMLACVLAAAMSSGDAFQVTVAGLFSENLYRVYVRPMADESQMVFVTRVTGIVIVLLSLLVAVLMRSSVVRTILDYFNILSLVGISTAMGILWRRMNTAGMFASTLSAVVAFILTRYVWDLGREVTIGVPIAVGVLAGVVASLLTRPPNRETTEKFFTKIYVPIGQEQKLGLPPEEAVPPDRRWLTWGGLFLVKPSRQSWLGFLAILGICAACVAAMLALLG